MKINHTALRVADFDEAIAWFVEKLDFRLLTRWQQGELQLAFVASPDDENTRIEILSGGGTPPSRPRTGWDHVCFSVPDLDAAIAKLKSRGVELTRGPFDAPHIKQRIAFFSDPSGNVFEITQAIA